MHGPTSNANTPRQRKRWAAWVTAAVALSAAFAALSFFRHGGRTSLYSGEQGLGAVPFARNEGTETASSDDGGAVDSLACRCDERTDSLGNHDDGAPLSSFAAELGLRGNVSDCCCSFADVEHANRNVVRPLLERVVSTPFFAHFRIDLCSDCPLWHDAPLCAMRDCSVCECDDPPAWAVVPTDCTAHVEEDWVVTDVDSRISGGWDRSVSPPPSFLSSATPSRHASDGGNEVVVDLRLNPERYTGYDGQSAEKVWTAIHSDNCFQAPQEEEVGEDESAAYCLLPAEQRVYNRIISGMHSSISIHIAHSYCLEMDPNQVGECRVWGPNVTLAKERVLDHKDRLENLYFAFSFLLRAVTKAGPAVTAAVPIDEAGDSLYADSILEWTESLLPEITRLEVACPKTFDEDSILMSGPGTDVVRSELQRRFRHLQQIMQCVGCDRCKLWGTLQALGVGTALRVLFHEQGGEELSLSRQEAVALVHTLERFSSALAYAHSLTNEYS